MRRYIPRRSEGAICTSWMRFKHIEPHQTFSNYILTEIARYIDFFRTSSGWFDWTEHSLTASLQGIARVQGAICTGLGSFLSTSIDGSTSLTASLLHLFIHGYAYSTLAPSIPCKDAVRGGSIQSNHPELT